MAHPAEQEGLDLSACMDELRDVFSLFDLDGDGSISSEELKSVISSLGINKSARELADLVHMVDLDRNGEIDFNEFLSMMTLSTGINAALLEEETARDLYRIFDVEEKGYLTLNSLRSLFGTIELNISDRQVKRMFSEADLTGNGRISFDEFRRMLQLIEI